jgi:hypothetical protein
MQMEFWLEAVRQERLTFEKAGVSNGAGYVVF